MVNVQCGGYQGITFFCWLLVHTAVAGGGDQTSYWEAMLSAPKEEGVVPMKEEMNALVEKTCGSWLMVQRM